MAPRTRPPFRADHVGSLLRPPALLRAREDFGGRPHRRRALRGLEDDAIRDAVRRQEEVGLQAATDGEFRRGSWHMDFIYQLDGISKAPAICGPVPQRRGRRSSSPPPRSGSTASSGSRGRSSATTSSLRDSVTTATPKLTIPSPSMVHYRGGRAAIDEASTPSWTSSGPTSRPPTPTRCAGSASSAAPTCSSTTPASPTSTTRSSARRRRDRRRPRAPAPEYIRHINEALADRPAGMTVTTHMCRGNFRSSWVAEGGYDFVAEALFNELDVDGFFWSTTTSAPAASSRCASCRREVGRARPGHHQARRARDEGRAQAPDRGGGTVRRARPALPLTAVRLLLHRRGQRPQLEQQVAKLRLVVETAHEVWG